MFGRPNLKKVRQLPFQEQLKTIIDILEKATKKGKKKITLQLYGCNAYYWDIEKELRRRHYIKIDRGIRDDWVITPESIQHIKDKKEADKDSW